MRWPVICLALLSGCVRSDFNLATRREEHTFTSTSREVAIGRKVAKRVTQELTVAADAAMQERVRALGARIAAVCDRKELVYTFTVVEDEQVNAFSLPGGYVFLHTGLVKKAASDDELAGVIAHEVAHIEARHAIKRFEGGLGLQLAQLATLAARQGTAARGLGVVSQAAQLAYARQDELEADRIGVRYMQAAGLDPKAMLSFLQKLQTVHQEKSVYLPAGVTRPHYAMTHPYVPDRIRVVKEALYGVADYLDYLNSPDR